MDPALSPGSGAHQDERVNHGPEPTAAPTRDLGIDPTSRSGAGPVDGAEIVTTGDGVGLALWDLGGTGEPLLAAHATMFCGHIWEPVAEHLDGFHCWAPDLRAHGHTVTPAEVDLSWPAVARDLLATVDHLSVRGARPRRAIGHSMGAAALLLAELARPGTFDELWCYDPVVRPTPPPEDEVENPLSAGARRRREVFPSRQAAFENYAAKPPLDSATPEALRAYVTWAFEDLDDGTVRLRCRALTEATIYRHGSRHGVFERLGEIRCPVTVVHGFPEEDRPSSWAPEVVARLPRGREVVFPRLSHFGPLEDPATIAGSISETFRR
jgi:pimeloyl-ACP methyl ester carboxylesterase